MGFPSNFKTTKLRTRPGQNLSIVNQVAQVDTSSCGQVDTGTINSQISLSQAQVQQLIQLINSQIGSSSTSGIASSPPLQSFANLAGTIYVNSSVFTATNHSVLHTIDAFSWILDTSATDHIICSP